MMRRIAMTLVVLALSGCMLPQPDTPIIPPHQTMGDPDRGAMPQETTPVQAPAGTEPAVPADPPASSALLSGQVTGARADAIVAVAEPGALSVRQELGGDGLFDLPLSPGTYRLELRVGVQVVTLEERITVKVGEERNVVLKLTRDPLKVTLEEAPADPPATP